MVSDVTVTNAINGQNATNASTAKLAEDFSQFLTLLTIQLQNQDPLDPLDTAEFTNQLVAFTGVEQQINTNQKLDDLVALNLGTAFSESQNYVGNDISYISSEFDYTGGAAQLRYSLQGEAVLAKLNIVDERGETIFTADAAKSAGAHEFIWDGSLTNGGKALPGTYQIRIDALDANGEPVESTTVVTGTVRGTESQGGQIFLLVGERAVPLSNVLNTSQTLSTSNNNESLTLALSYVGLDINYLNNELQYNGTDGEEINYSLPKDADRATILISDDSGQVIFTADVPKDKGSNTFTWDGRKNDNTPAPAGTYNFVIDAIDESDVRIPVSTTATGTVTGVETLDGQIFLNVGGASVNINNVLSANVASDA